MIPLQRQSRSKIQSALYIWQDWQIGHFRYPKILTVWFRCLGEWNKRKFNCLSLNLDVISFAYPPNPRDQIKIAKMVQNGYTF